jgi:hypothetical protein
MGKIQGNVRKRLAAGAIGVGLLLAASEIGLRVFVGLGSPPLSHADPDYGYAFNRSLPDRPKRIIASVCA